MPRVVEMMKTREEELLKAINSLSEKTEREVERDLARVVSLYLAPSQSCTSEQETPLLGLVKSSHTPPHSCSSFICFPPDHSAQLAKLYTITPRGKEILTFLRTQKKPDVTTVATQSTGHRPGNRATPSFLRCPRHP